MFSYALKHFLMACHIAGMAMKCAQSIIKPSALQNRGGRRIKAAITIPIGAIIAFLHVQNITDKLVHQRRENTI